MQPVTDELLDTGEDAALTDDEQAQLDAQKAAEQQRQAIVQALGQRLRSEFDKRKTDRQLVEQRWQEDTAQYNARYEPEVLDELKRRDYGSRAFVPLTRRICNIVEARLGDLLFPTDDRNFVIKASPVPELSDAEGMAKRLGERPVSVDGQQIPANTVTLGIRELVEAAERKSMNMQRAVDDQLEESNYPKHARACIRDAIKLGTGILKGPTVLLKAKKRWSLKGGVRILEMVQDTRAAVVRVSPWNFFPDLSGTEIGESDGNYELHRKTRAELSELARRDDFDREALKRVIEGGSPWDRDQNLADRKADSGTANVEDRRFNLVEFNGAIEGHVLSACGCDVPDDTFLTYNATVFFSERTGDVVKAALHPMDGNPNIYHVFNWQPDDASIFGYGLPYEIRDMQEAGNSSFRGALDNMGLTVGPMVVANTKAIRPMDGKWSIGPRKIFDLKEANVPVGNVFGFYQIDSRVTELMAVFNLAKQLAEEIGGPMLAMQGQEAPNYVQAGATGMSIAYNAASIWMRRAVRLWDDQVTMPLIGSFIDWNMQFNPDPGVFGDHNLIPRGTSALLEAEGTVARITLLSQLSAQFGIPLRKAINQLRAMARAMRLDPDELLPDDAEVKSMEEQQAKNGPPPNPELLRLQVRELEMKDRAADRETQLQIQQASNQVRLAEIASREGLTMQELRVKYDLGQQKLSQDAQKFNAEVAVAAAKGSGI